MRTWLLLLCTYVMLPAIAVGQVAVDFPLGVGLRVPEYDRVDGLVLPYGPTITVGEDRLVVDPVVTYRSQIGKIDPSLDVAWHPTSVLTLSLTGARGTFSNDSWIRSDLINSLYTFAYASDTRNYFRADRAEGKVAVSLPTGTATTSLYAGLRLENAWSTGLQSGDRGAPYSVFHWRDTLNGMQRPNPLITPGHIASALIGGDSRYEKGDVTNHLRFLFEDAWDSPTSGHFQQITLHDHTKIPTWAGERFEITVHAVTTVSGTVPPQRYAYLGGSGTLATIDLLSLGGDHLYFTDIWYELPIPNTQLPVFGSLYVAPHFVDGAAGVGGFGPPTQNVGVRLRDALIKVDFLVNPKTHESNFTVGFGFSR